MADVDLTTTYLGLELANPIVASSSPLTRQVETMHELVEAGVGAIVLASVFEEEIDDDAHLHGYLEELEGGIMAEAVEGHLPMVEAAHSGLTRHLAHIHRAADEIHVPVIGSLNGSIHGGFTQYAAMIADAGVDALELNVYLMPADVDTPGEEIERRYLDIVEEVRAAVTLPLAV